jgi:hypothetical protein
MVPANRLLQIANCFEASWARPVALRETDTSILPVITEGAEERCDFTSPHT